MVKENGTLTDDASKNASQLGDWTDSFHIPMNDIVVVEIRKPFCHSEHLKQSSVHSSKRIGSDVLTIPTRLAPGYFLRYRDSSPSGIHGDITQNSAMSVLAPKAGITLGWFNRFQIVSS